MPLEGDENKSEVARLKRQITEEYEAAQRGLSGLASGAARHAFISAKMRRMDRAHQCLIGLLGRERAGEELIDAIGQANLAASGETTPTGKGETLCKQPPA